MIIIPNYDFRIKQLEDRVSFLEEKTDLVSFVLASYSTQTINSDNVNPSMFDNLFLGNANKVSFDETYQAVKNDSGKVIPYLEGTINFQPNKQGGGIVVLNLVSERSSDGGQTWVGNLNSLRTIEISNSGESFKTDISILVDWQPDELVRFRAFNDGGSNIVFESPTNTILNQSFNGPSILWTLQQRMGIN